MKPCRLETYVKSHPQRVGPVGVQLPLDVVEWTRRQRAPLTVVRTACRG